MLEAIWETLLDITDNFLEFVWPDGEEAEEGIIEELLS